MNITIFKEWEKIFKALKRDKLLNSEMWTTNIEAIIEEKIRNHWKTTGFV